MQIRSYKQITNLVENKARIVIEKTSEEILRIFKEEFLEKIVYNSHGVNAFYDPTDDFLNAWEWKQIKKEANMLVTELWYNWSTMRSPSLDKPENFVHGSSFSRPNDVRDNLMDILNKSGRSSKSNLSVYRPAPYWDVFILAMFQGGKISQIISQEMKKAGFTKKK